MRGILKGVNFWLGTHIKWRVASETLSETYRTKSIWRVVRTGGSSEQGEKSRPFGEAVAEKPPDPVLYGRSWGKK